MLDKVANRFDTIIQNSGHLRSVLRPLNAEQQQRVFVKVQDQLPKIIQNQEGMNRAQQALQSINGEHVLSHDANYQQIIEPLEREVERLKHQEAYPKAVAASYLIEHLKHAYVTRQSNQAFWNQARGLIQQAKQGPLAEHRHWFNWFVQRLAHGLNKLTLGAIQSYGLFSYDCYRATLSIKNVNEIESAIDNIRFNTL